MLYNKLMKTLRQSARNLVAGGGAKITSLWHFATRSRMHIVATALASTGLLGASAYAISTNLGGGADTHKSEIQAIAGDAASSKAVKSAKTEGTTAKSQPEDTTPNTPKDASATAAPPKLSSNSPVIVADSSYTINANIYNGLFTATLSNGADAMWSGPSGPSGIYGAMQKKPVRSAAGWKTYEFMIQVDNSVAPGTYTAYISAQYGKTNITKAVSIEVLPHPTFTLAFNNEQVTLAANQGEVDLPFTVTPMYRYDKLASPYATLSTSTGATYATPPAFLATKTNGIVKIYTPATPRTYFQGVTANDDFENISERHVINVE